MNDIMGAEFSKHFFAIGAYGNSIWLGDNASDDDEPIFPDSIIMENLPETQVNPQSIIQE